jgi:predicted transcriptional regulator
MAKALDLDFRRDLLAMVKRYPGLHLRELARQLGTSVALVEYHIPVLLNADLIDVDADGYQRVFPKDLLRVNRAWLGVLREEIPMQVTLLLLRRGPLRHGAICDGLGFGKSKVTFHLKKLQAARLVIKQDLHFAIGDEKAVTQLLIANKPTNDFRDRFASLWANFYG